MTPSIKLVNVFEQSIFFIVTMLMEQRRQIPLQEKSNSYGKGPTGRNYTPFWVRKAHLYFALTCLSTLIWRDNWIFICLPWRRWSAHKATGTKCTQCTLLTCGGGCLWKSRVSLECPWTFRELGLPFAQCYDLTALQMQPSKDTDP